MKPVSLRLQKMVDDFNARFPVGTKVILQTDAGPVETTVRAAAQLLGFHSPVAWFDGVSGCYSIASGTKFCPGERVIAR